MFSVLISALLALQGVPKPDRPNLIIVYCDDVGYGDLGCYGNPVIRTPNLDRFAAEGMRLTACYAGAPNCSPSRAALLTGRAPYRVGVYDILSSRLRSDMELPASEITLAEVLGATGYETYHAGKWHLSQAKDTKPALEHGFDHSIEVQAATALVDGMISWLDGRDDDARPFFAYLALAECHGTGEERSPPEFRALYESSEEEEEEEVRIRGKRVRAKLENRSAYFGCVSQMDSAFGRLLDYLEASGLRESSVIFFASDNGPSQLNENAWGSTGVLRGGKGTLYEGGIRVPGLIQWPGHTVPGTVCDEPVHVWDILPTFCELAGVDPPVDRAIDGTSLVSLLEGGALSRSAPLYWGSWCSLSGGNSALREGDWKIVGTLEPMRADRTTMEHIKEADLVRFNLYRVTEDPAELSDLSRSEPEVFERLKARLLTVHADILRDGPTFDLNAYRHRGNRGRQEKD